MIFFSDETAKDEKIILIEDDKVIAEVADLVEMI